MQVLTAREESGGRLVVACSTVRNDERVVEIGACDG